MSVKLEQKVRSTGTKFLVYAQPRTLKAFAKPEVVHVSIPPHQVGAGPSDDRIYVLDAIHKRPYGARTQPPYKGKVHPLILPSRGGHYTHLKPETREFATAAMYATVRRVLDIWEDYLEKEIPWSFAGDHERLELLPLVKFDNAQAGYGFLEFGFAADPKRARLRDAYCLNFDVLAHEFGHCMIDCLIGYPATDAATSIDYGGFHESAADLVSIISALHFDSVVRHLLDATRGNLFSVNELSRIGELSQSREIRRSFNSHKMSDVGTEPHDRSEPLTGAFFDVLVEVFQKELVRKRLISADLARRSTQGLNAHLDDPRFPREFASAYRGNRQQFTAALLHARDYTGHLLARLWRSLPADNVGYHDIFRRTLRADAAVSGGKHRQTITECFAWREIGTPHTSQALRIRSIKHCTNH